MTGQRKPSVFSSFFSYLLKRDGQDSDRPRRCHYLNPQDPHMLTIEHQWPADRSSEGFVEQESRRSALVVDEYKLGFTIPYHMEPPRD
jgi:hypothetical protein